MIFPTFLLWWLKEIAI